MPNIELPKAAVRADLPAEIRFLVASSSFKPPDGDNWLHEVKHDGHRLLTVSDGRGGLTLRSRSGFNRTDLFRSLFGSSPRPVENWCWMARYARRTKPVSPT
jgi:bifunctional non-homologous end joining protein LigD